MRFARSVFVGLVTTAAALVAGSVTSSAPGGEPVWGGELRFAIHAEPKTWDPLMAADDASAAIRMLTQAPLVRMNRKTQKFEPQLAESWKVTENGRKIVFQLRSGVEFSDGTPFTADDVAATLKKAMNPELHSPMGDSLIAAAGTGLKIETPGGGRVVITFPAPVANPVGLIEGLPMLSAKSPKAVLGPFELAEYKAGAYVELKRNPKYWRTGAGGDCLISTRCIWTFRLTATLNFSVSARAKYT